MRRPVVSIVLVRERAVAHEPDHGLQRASGVRDAYLKPEPHTKGPPHRHTRAHAHAPHPAEARAHPIHGGNGGCVRGQSLSQPPGDADRLEAHSQVLKATSASVRAGACSHYDLRLVPQLEWQRNTERAVVQYSHANGTGQAPAPPPRPSSALVASQARLDGHVHVQCDASRLHRLQHGDCDLGQPPRVGAGAGVWPAPPVGEPVSSGAPPRVAPSRAAALLLARPGLAALHQHHRPAL
mmetsp:Transcript_3478/g.14061  ORF Transcript_3478/g.14061 Transcript_3478/m.14061 type:complete len:239 (-) Transcript_3478:151-867(-)